MSASNENKSNYQDPCIGLPENTEYPFFAYGFFKSDELAYGKIANFVVSKPQPLTVEGLLYEKDGLPIFVNKYQDNAKRFYPILGELIFFCNEETCNGKRAYRKIANIEPGKLYCWDTIDIRKDGGIQKANILVACSNLLSEENAVNGAIKLKGIDDRYFPDKGVAWHGYKDILFTKGMEFLEKKFFNQISFLSFDEGYIYKDENLYKLFSLQMAYAFLWTIIDRHNTIKYRINSDNLKKQREEMAKDVLFRKAIEIIGDSFNYNFPEIYASDSAASKSFNGAKNNPVDDWYKKIEMYYQVRCNIVHRGKAGLDATDFPKLRGAFLDMFAIMQYMLRIELKRDLKGNEYTEEKALEGIKSLKGFKLQFKRFVNNG